MKKSIYRRVVLTLMAVLPCVAFAQEYVSNNNQDEVNKTSEWAPQFREGQVIVKFKNSSTINISKAKGKVKCAVSAVDNAFTRLGVTEAESLMPLTGAITTAQPRKAKAFNGKVVEEPDLSKLYCLSFDTTNVKTVPEAVEILKKMDDVEYAEPNYIVYTCETKDSATYVQEPLYNYQWGLPAINMPSLWNVALADTTRPVIAILDTGVDITHPDLAANIWTNQKEADGSDYADDDNNGYVDDLHGWDFVAKTAIIKSGRDNNGHGTHCAGIAAAVGDNGIGITGANPDAYIMPVKVMGDNGSGDMATIVKGIDYAVASGAKVLSMSFGSSFSSSSLYQALEKAASHYIILVAAAGNNGKSIYVRSVISGLSYPGAYDLVVGVMASDQNGKLASYSNFDPDGPFFSKDADFLNYDVLAPGSKIASTWPNGKYVYLNGTSMATPMVAGAVSRILQVKGYDYAKDYAIQGDIAMSKMNDSEVFNAAQVALWEESNRQVALAITSYSIKDTITGGDGDGIIDAGETIELYPTIKSIWGHASNVKIHIACDNENIPDSTFTILNNDVDFGYTLSSRSSLISKNPIRVKINQNVNDGFILPITFTVTSDNLLQGFKQIVNCVIKNGVEIGGMIDHDMTLYPDKHYVLSSNLVVPEGYTLTIMPGSIITIPGDYGISIFGNLIADGNKEKRIKFICDDWRAQNGYHYHLSCIKTYGSHSSKYSYCDFDNVGVDHDLQYIQTYDSASYCKYYHSPTDCQNRDYCYMYYSSTDKSNSSHCLLLEPRDFIIPDTKYASIVCPSEYRSYYCNFDAVENANCNGVNLWIKAKSETPIFLKWENPPYLGSTTRNILKKRIIDFNSGEYENYAVVSLDNIRERPYAEAPAIVWKVVVDGHDAQDEFDSIPPLGVGKHKFEVYYSRSDVDTTSTPVISMGLKTPFTQTEISEDGFWSIKDSVCVYTAYLTISGKSAYDGLNRICVDGVKDVNQFDIPAENTRFNVLVQAAGSMSAGFQATAALGKVELEWATPSESDMQDMMGYNMYRYTMLNDSVASDTIRINTQLIGAADTTYVDYNVTAGTTYYYFYKVMGSDLTENDPSKTVAATPLTSIKGDSNGDMTVNVLDVMTDVAYMTFDNPEPFIFDAADVNGDGTVDILDVVGTVWIITTPTSDTNAASVNSCATYTIEDGTLYVDSPVAIGGVQATIGATRDDEITPLEALSGMEQVSTQMTDNSRIFLAYSASGATISTGKQALLKLGNATLTNLVLSDAHGKQIMAIEGTATGMTRVDAAQIKLPYPNPFTSTLNVPYVMGKDNAQSAKLMMTDVMGRIVASYNVNASYGEHTANIDGGHLANGLYFLTLTVDGQLVQTTRVIKK